MAAVTAPAGVRPNEGGGITQVQKGILHFFDLVVFRYMFGDVHAALKEEAYVLAALGLLCYTEVLGGLRTGNLGLKGHSREDFNQFLEYLAHAEKELRAPGIDIYEGVRSGVVHQYFVKGTLGIVNEHGDRRAVIPDGKGGYNFNVIAYSRLFFEGAARYRDEMLEKADSPLVANFMKCIARLGEAEA